MTIRPLKLERIGVHHAQIESVQSVGDGFVGHPLGTCAVILVSTCMVVLPDSSMPESGCAFGGSTAPLTCVGSPSSGAGLAIQLCTTVRTLEGESVLTGDRSHVVVATLRTVLWEPYVLTVAGCTHRERDDFPVAIVLS